MDERSHLVFLKLLMGEGCLQVKEKMKTENPANTAFPSIIHCSFPSFKEFTDLSPNNYPIYSQIDHKNLISKKAIQQQSIASA
jgi:hypothetical protein